MHYGKQPLKTYLNFAESHQPNYGVVAVDQEKFNFIWLNFPGIEVHGLRSVPQAVIDGVCQYMDRGTRAMLKKRPLDFMRYWDSVDTLADSLGLALFLPTDYRATMQRQAEEAQKRLFPVVREGNVIRVRLEGPGGSSDVPNKVSDGINHKIDVIADFLPTSSDVNDKTAVGLVGGSKSSSTIQIDMTSAGQLDATQSIEVKSEFLSEDLSPIGTCASSEESRFSDDIEALVGLARKYDHGDGVDRNCIKAAELYLKAAEEGHMAAQNNLGVIYTDGGTGVAQNKKKAADWFLRAAEQGLAVAQYNFANLLMETDGGFYDPEQAAIWYRKAADQKDSDAEYSLGECYENGVGVFKDTEQAMLWYRKAFEHGNEDAQVSLLRLKNESKGQGKPLFKAKSPTLNGDVSFSLSPEAAISFVRTAIELIKHSPGSFVEELTELRNFVLVQNQEDLFHEASSGLGILQADESRLVNAANWLLSFESVGLVALRDRLLPLDMLPGAVIDELNERALDLTGEIALEESGEEILVFREVLATVDANQK